MKAFGIMAVIAGHLGISIFPFFPEYSFHMALFFFISGMLYKNNYSLTIYIKRRFNSLIKPYIIYCAVYLLITILLYPLVGKFWAEPITLYNEFVLPFLTGHQILLISPLWFVPQLFISLITYKLLNYVWLFIENKLSLILKSQKIELIKLITYLLIAISATFYPHGPNNLVIIPILRTMFSLFFIHIGFIYYNKIEKICNIFTFKFLFCLLIIQSLFWLMTNNGIPFYYELAFANFNKPILPIFTSITGILFCLFITEKTYIQLKDWKFFQQIGTNTYHLMANHLFLLNILTYISLMVFHKSFELKNLQGIYWLYAQTKVQYLYFFLIIFVIIYGQKQFEKLKKYIDKKIMQ